MKLARLVLLLAVLAVHSYSQTPALQGHDDLQSWNDLFLTVPMSKRVDFFTRLTAQFSKNVSRLDDQRFAIGIVWKPAKALSISPFYWYLYARNAFGKFRIENELNLAATYRFPIRRFGLSHRSQFERRLRIPVNSWRYRAQFTVDKDIPKHLIPKAKWFVSDEVFHDSLLNRFSRNRFAAGISKTLSPHLAVDIYYMRQNDGIARPGNLHTIWTAWKIRA